NTNLIRDGFFTPGVRQAERLHRDKVEDVIDFLNLQPYRDKPINSLPYGVRKVAEIARALCIEPTLILLDEPSSGLNPEETEDLAFWIQDINRLRGITIILVEHDMRLVKEVSHTVVAINSGRVLAKGKPQDVLNNAEVVRAYLGS
ncbi:MAG: ATP-binding cassette domain-containing protein, partial [Desulfobacterales bacterium]|nr:ATP-binding cassette domain-containing protein [Desulfobacterales bacterium]